MKELEYLRKEAGEIQSQIAAFEGKVAALEMETKGPVKIIAKLDLVKERMKRVTRVLEGARKFDALSLDMEHALHVQEPERVRSSGPKIALNWLFNFLRLLPCWLKWTPLCMTCETWPNTRRRRRK